MNDHSLLSWLAISPIAVVFILLLVLCLQCLSNIKKLDEKANSE